MLAQTRQFSLLTFFITRSSADIQWPELLVILKLNVENEIISEKDAANLTYGERARLIQKDPVTCSQYFDQRFKAIKKTWDSPDGPFHNYKSITVNFQFKKLPTIFFSYTCQNQVKRVYLSLLFHRQAESEWLNLKESCNPSLMIQLKMDELIIMLTDPTL